MRFYHSYWTKPALTTMRWGIKAQYYMSLIHTALSVVYLKRLGQEIVLHTDEMGKKLYDCLPYDEINLTLDKNPAPVMFWASAKFAAMRVEDTKSIHVDTDFFVKSQGIIDVISENPLVFPNSESTEKYQPLIKDLSSLMTRNKIMHTFAGNEKTSINMGLFKCDNADLKRAFQQHYWRFVAQLIQCPEFVQTYSGNNQPQKCPDLVIEQLLMKKLVDEIGIKPAFLVAEKDIEYTNTKEIGFCHLLAMDKYTKIPEQLRRLKELDDDIYARVLRRFEELGFEILNVKL